MREVSAFLLKDGREVRVLSVDEECNVPDCEWVGLRDSFNILSFADYSIASKGRELAFWNEQNRFCSVCGKELMRKSRISKYCPDCEREVWPTLAVAVIVAITKGDEILLTRNRNFKGNYWGLVAGFVETGETLEECVNREVMEEVGISIKDLKYFASQPWPYPSNLMVGFTAEYAGGEIKVQQEELLEAAWFSLKNLPEIPGKVSLARSLIEHCEAKHGD